MPSLPTTSWEKLGPGVTVSPGGRPVLQTGRPSPIQAIRLSHLLDNQPNSVSSLADHPAMVSRLFLAS